MKIELYIENRSIDLDNDVNFAISRALSDIFNPSDIKNDWSKTVSIPNTDTNNQLFGKIFSVNRLVDTIVEPNIGKDFNPSKKANFRLVVNGIKLMSGYIKMTDVNFISDKLWRYEVNLFGELGNFLSEFKDITLKDLLINGTTNPYKNNNILLRGTALNNLWNIEANGKHRWRADYYADPSKLYTAANWTNRTVSSLADDYYSNIFIDLIDAENGLYNEGNMIEFAEGKNTDAVRGVSKIDQKYTEQQLCIKDVTKQRFGMYTDMLLLNTLKQIGYDLDLTTDFFNKDNPYWSRMLVTCPILENTSLPNTEFSVNYTNTSVVDQKFGNDRSTRIYLQPQVTSNSFMRTATDSGRTVVKMKDVKYGQFKTSLNMNLGNDTFRIMRELAPSIWEYIPNGLYKPVNSTSSNVFFSFDIVYSDYDYSPQLPERVTKRIELVGGTTLGIISETDTTIRMGFQLYKVSNSNYQFIIDGSGTTLRDYINGINITKSTKLNAGRSLYYYINAYINGGRELVSSVAGSIFTNNMKYETPINISATEYYTMDNRLISNMKVDYSEFLPNIKAQDFFLSLVKLFGLYIDVDTETKVVRLLTRNEFFAQNNVLDWNDKFNKDDSYTLKLLNFESKFIEIRYDKGIDQLNKNFEKEINPYGAMKLNTGYDFNNDSYNLLEGVKFQPSISANISRDVYGLSNKIIPHYFDGETLESSKVVSPLALVFKNGYVNNPQIRQKVNNGSNNRKLDYFFIFTQNSWKSVLYDDKRYNMDRFNGFDVAYGNIDIKKTYISNPYLGPIISGGKQYIQYSNHYPSITNPQFSLDIYKPTQIAYPITYNANGTIYSRFWKKYLGDRYNVNTKVFTGFFNLTYKDVVQFNFSDFIYFRGMIWTVNKIIDYNPESLEPTRVELISVQDKENYTNSIKLD